MNQTPVLYLNSRVWDLTPGDTFRGRTIAAIRGVVGFASNPVAIMFFVGNERRPIRFPAAYSDTCQHGDYMSYRAREWVRVHELHEGDALDLHQLRLEVTE